MTEEIKKKTNDLYDKVETFVQSVLNPRGIRMNQVAIVGSLALALHDVPVEDVHDIDLEVFCTERQEEVFKILSDIYGNDFYKEKEDSYIGTEWVHKPYIFVWKDIKFNVWCVKEWSHKTGLVLGNGLVVAGVDSILQCKLRYKRRKDFEYIAFLIKRLSMFLTKK